MEMFHTSWKTIPEIHMLSSAARWMELFRWIHSTDTGSQRHGQGRLLSVLSTCRIPDGLISVVNLGWGEKMPYGFWDAIANLVRELATLDPPLI